MIFALALQATGGWMRYFAGSDYEWTLIGNILLGIAQCFILEIPTCKISIFLY